MPSYSIGFCVATTRNGSSSGYVTPSIVTWHSCIASSSADCVFGDARLISSTSRTFVKTGPGPELELVRLLVEDVDAGDVRREQVGRELEPREREMQRARERLREHRLPHPREVLDDQVALGEEPEHAELERLARRPDRELEVRDDARDDVRRRGRRTALRAGTASLIASRVAAPPRRARPRRSPAWAPSELRSPPPSEMSRTTSFSAASKPMSSRLTSLNTKRSAFLARRFSRARSSPVPAPSAAKPTSTWPVAPRGAERSEDVGRRLERDRPRGAVLRPLVVTGRGRPVVGDGGGHDDDVGVRARERLALEVGGGRRLDDRRRPPERTRRGLRRAASPRRRGARASSASATPIRPEERLPRNRTESSGSRVPPAETRTVRSAQRAAAAIAGEDLARRARRSPRARPCAPRRSRPPRARPPPGRRSRRRASRSVATFACVAACSHMRTFIAGATRTGPSCASAASVRRSSASPCASRASVFAVSGATTRRSARSRCGYGSSLRDLPREREERLGGDEPLGCRR